MKAACSGTGRSAAPTTPIHFNSLTGLRFIAAFMVLLGHGYPLLQFENSAAVMLVLDPLAAAAMQVFFVLSGVVLWLNYADGFQRGAFAPRSGVFRLPDLHGSIHCCSWLCSSASSQRRQTASPDHFLRA